MLLIIRFRFLKSQGVKSLTRRLFLQTISRKFRDRFPMILLKMADRLLSPESLRN